MAGITNAQLFSLLTLFTIFFNNFASSKYVKEAKMNEIAEVFNEIEKNQHKLKEEFEEILKEEEDEEMIKEEDNYQSRVYVQNPGRQNPKECVCIPYHLCSPETGGKITDGRYLLETRVSLCENPTHVCCVKSSPPPAQKRIMPPPTPKCGYASENNEDFPSVEDPSIANFGQFPWTIMIAKNKGYACVGSLIHPKVVLTAAHCLNISSNFSVRAGEWNAVSKSEPLIHQTRYVEQVINHPEFQLDNLIYDVALLVINEEFELQEHINTVCLTNSAPQPLITSPDKCVVTGWGVDKPNGRYNKIMSKIEFSLANHKDCQDSLRPTRLGDQFQLHQSFICAFGLHGSDACQGNAGAPLVCSLSDQRKRYQQVGIVSWGIGCATPNVPSVFTKISQIRDWIDNMFDMLGYSKEYYTA